MKKLHLALIALCCTSYAVQAMHDNAGLIANITTQVRTNIPQPIHVLTTIECIIREKYIGISDVECWLLTVKVILQLTNRRPN